MDDTRNRIDNLINYIESLGIDVYVNKTSAQGNKGFFKVKNNRFRIDISKSLSVDESLSVILHEFGHYIHYSYDKSLKRLDFIFDDIDETLREELLRLTVDSVSKQTARDLFDLKNTINNKINAILTELKNNGYVVNRTLPNKEIEKEIKSCGAEYLLKYDKVKIIQCFKFRFLDIENLDSDFTMLSNSAKKYLVLKSLQRKLKKVSSKISRLNRYYNMETELFARSFEKFILSPERCKELAPNVFNKYQNMLLNKKDVSINKVYEIMH